MTLANLNGNDVVNAALGMAADNQRFAEGDIASILRSSGRSVNYRAGQDRFLQGGTRSWQDFGAGSVER